MQQAERKIHSSWDSDKFRLRRLVERLIDMGEVEIHDEPVALSEISGFVEATRKAILFRKAGPEQLELVSTVTGERRRLAAAFGVTEDKLREEFLRRMANPQKTFDVPSSDAPVQEVVQTGDEIDLTKLPFYVQHEFDGGPYISSGIDYVIDPRTGLSNVGARRLMLRGKNKCGFNLTAPSDLREIYLAAVARGERLECSFTIGAHPLDTMGSASRSTGHEINALATLRGEPMAVVKGVTNDIYVPADAEIVLEGYIDERGYIDPEGPYGEYMGFYGPMHGDPVFHVTAITRRHDVLHQTLKHGYGRQLSQSDSAPMGQFGIETRSWGMLKQAGLDPTAVFVPEGPSNGLHLRVAIRKKTEADARIAITVLLGGLAGLKHVWITDEDVDIRSSTEMEWTMGSRFQADTGTMIFKNMPARGMDLSSGNTGIGTKAGYDLTFPYPRPKSVTYRIPEAPKIGGPARFQTVAQALESGPMHFAKLMSALGSRDGREIVMEIEGLRDQGLLDRNSDGEYHLK